MPVRIGFKSYCWSIGTTSYRTDNFNMNIELQLKLLNEFWKNPDNAAQSWQNNNSLQADYYSFLRNNNFVTGDAKLPDKDAREKTSGLRDIGLLDDGRRLTDAGKRLLEISQKNNFDSDNYLEIAKDSYLYFKQLLKTYNVLDGRVVRPFIVFLYVVSRTKYLTFDEFTFLLPLCIDKKTTCKIVDLILESRKNGINYENIILSVLLDMDNYKAALELMNSEPMTEELICAVGINRKSARYDKPYYALYQILRSIVFGKENLAEELYYATKKLTNNKVGGAWREYFFSSRVMSVIKRKGIGVLKNAPILKCKTDKDFNIEFFKIMHLFKAKATLSDYFDLNRRYFKVSDVVLFRDGLVRLDVLPKCYIENISDDLFSIAFEKTELLDKNCEIEEIHPSLKIDSQDLYKRLGKDIGKNITDKYSARKVIRDERYIRFNKLIDEKWDKVQLGLLLDYFKNRNDVEIRKLVTDNADIPTIFEYILGVIWYIVSDRQGEVLEYMNLSLDADLLPKTHAGGGEADIVWKYNQSEFFQQHTLLIEATLADGSNQRRMEMEPVSRHLGEYLLNYPNSNAYCIFITTYLHNNVISDFRMRRIMEYYNSAGNKFVSGMKIFPLQTDDLKQLLEKDIKYHQIYSLLEEVYESRKSPKQWYDEDISGGIKSMN